MGWRRPMCVFFFSVAIDLPSMAISCISKMRANLEEPIDSREYADLGLFDVTLCLFSENRYSQN